MCLQYTHWRLDIACKKARCGKRADVQGETHDAQVLNVKHDPQGDAQIFAVAASTITGSELDQSRLREERRNHVAESMKA